MSDQISGVFSPFLRRRRIFAVQHRLYGRVLDIGCGVGYLARHVASDSYLGVDIDQHSIEIAGSTFPNHQFRMIDVEMAWTSDVEGQRFDTIVMLALIEHLADPPRMLRSIVGLLDLRGTMILTTPHPAFGWSHRIGAKLGLFSRAADEEHQELLGPSRMVRIAAEAGLNVVMRKRFLFGANQLFVLKHAAADVNNLA